MSEKQQRIAITGMSINTPIGDNLADFEKNLLAGRSALSNWKTLDTSRIYSKVGADLSEYPIPKKLGQLEGALDPETFRRLRKLVSKSPWSTKLSMLLAADAWVHAGMRGVYEPERIASIVAGHNINFNHQYENRLRFVEEPDHMDALLALTGLDTDHAGCVSEALDIRGPIYTVGSACASGNTALRCAIDEIRHHGCEAALVVGAVLDFSPVELHAMALMGAIAYQSFNDEPQRASRPFDTRREGFVPAHGGAVLVVEPYDAAVKRGAKIWAEVLAVDTCSDANHLPNPSEDGQSYLMKKVLDDAGLRPEDIDYVNAHATSTPLGDITEIRSIKRVFGKHAYNLKINATKSMLGHTCWAAPAVETVAAVLQMHAGKLHPSINVETIDPEIDLDVLANRGCDARVRTCMKNSFGFGGINAVSILRTPS